MTKTERILKKQIKELERLVEIKEEVIIELKTLIRSTYYPNTVVSPFYPQLPIYGDNITISTYGSDSVTGTDIDCSQLGNLK